MRRAAAVLAAALTSLALLGCADDAPDAPELVISVATDFAAGELSYLVVETLDVQGELAVDARWLTVGEACPTRTDGLRALGTFSVQRGDQALARLQLRALQRGPDGKALEVGRERVDALFARGRVTLEMTLGKLCSAIACPADETCDPLLGACRAVQRLALPASEPVAPLPEQGCIVPLAEAPPEVLPRVPPSSLCVRGDGRCDAPCTVRDADCLRARGEPCQASADCGDGALCVHGFCCDGACGGPCERCDLPDRAGSCSALHYADPRAPRSSPDFVGLCDDHHLEYACAAGACSARCSGGFADCNGVLQEDGCETRLATPSDCRACGDACRYGHCDEQGCTHHHTTALETSATRQLNPGKLYASTFLPTSADRSLRALGALVHPDLAGSTLRLALYTGNAAGVPDKLVAQTEVVPSNRASASGLTAPRGAILAEGPVTPTALEPGDPYFVAVQVKQPTLLFGGEGTLMPWYVSPAPYEAFPAYFPPEEVAVHEFIALTVYAVTTPH